MADRATQTITISAPVDTCFAIVADFPRYPDWARDVKAADVVAADDQGRPVEVAFTAAAMGRETSYTLQYDWSGAPERIVWQLVRGDIMEAIDGSYTFTPSTTVPGGTDVVYDLSIALRMPLPGFVKRRAEVRILNTIKELKARAESQVTA
jgi:uncharacterized membrane protein